MQWIIDHCASGKNETRGALPGLGMLVRAGVDIEEPPTDRPWGARSFVIRDPNGVVLHLSHPIPAAVEFAACVR